MPALHRLWPATPSAPAPFHLHSTSPRRPGWTRVHRRRVRTARTRAPWCAAERWGAGGRARTTLGCCMAVLSTLSRSSPRSQSASLLCSTILTATCTPFHLPARRPSAPLAQRRSSQGAVCLCTVCCCARMCIELAVHCPLNDGTSLGKAQGAGSGKQGCGTSIRGARACHALSRDPSTRQGGKRRRRGGAHRGRRGRSCRAPAAAQSPAPPAAPVGARNPQDHLWLTHRTATPS